MEATAWDVRNMEIEVERLEEREKELENLLLDARHMPFLKRLVEWRRTKREIEQVEEALKVAHARLMEERAWRHSTNCPPDRTREDHERFRAEYARLQKEYGNPPTDTGNARTFEDLRKWRAWGETEEERTKRLGEAERRGGHEARRKELRRQKLEYGWIDEREYKRREAEALDEQYLEWLRGDLADVRENGYDPNEMHDLSKQPEDKDYREIREWIERRPEVERRVDELAARAEVRGFELSDNEKEMIRTLGELREAENERRQEKELDRDDDPEPPAGGSSVPVDGGGGRGGGGAVAEADRERREQEEQRRREKLLGEMRLREEERDQDDERDR